MKLLRDDGDQPAQSGHVPTRVRPPGNAAAMGEVALCCGGCADRVLPDDLFCESCGHRLLNAGAVLTPIADVRDGGTRAFPSPSSRRPE